MNDKLKVSKVESKGYGNIYKLPMMDRDLDVVAKAFYAYLCSFAGQGETAFPGMDKICSDLGVSRQRLERHRKALVQKGYININQIKENGKFARNEYTINKEISPMLQNATTEKPTTENATTENATSQNVTINNNIFNNNNKDNNINKDNKTVHQDELFEQFWKVYPRKQVKKTSKDKFKLALKKYDFETIMKGTYKYAELCRIKNTSQEYIAQCTTFLNQERYLDDYDALITEHQNNRNGGYRNEWHARPNEKPSFKETFRTDVGF